MSGLTVFQDADCSVEVEQVLYEGRTYFLNFPTTDEKLIKAALADAGIEEFVSWHRLNRVATLRVVNRIGLITFFGRVFDVRSEKLLEAETGARQFQIILDDLALLSRHILFEHTTAPSAHRSHRTDSQQPSLLERFNYYRQTCLPMGKRPGLEALLERILRNPHSRLVDENIRDHIWNVRKPSGQTLRSLFHHDQRFTKLPSDHFLTVSRPGLRISGTGESIFPLKALRTRGGTTFDTPENRFVKHLLLDVERVCCEVARKGLVSGSLFEQCHRLLNLSRTSLRRDFFQDVGQLQAVPSSSPTLTQRHGYRDLYRIFVRNRVGAKHLFEDFAEESLFIELKDIALLYEYWVFYKVAATLLKPGAIFLARDAVVKEGRIVNSGVVTDGVLTVHFNRTFTRKPGGSYSLRLRPDVVVEYVQPGGVPISLYLLDAKYKSVDQTPEEEEDPLLQPIRAVTTTDLHKMHCYADAIEGVVSAVAIYPGTKFLFYPRERSVGPITQPQPMASLHGIGAVPLLPGSASVAFDEFMKLAKAGDNSAAHV